MFAELGNRRIRRGESIRQYIIEMQSITMHSDVSEYELVQFILDGIQWRLYGGGKGGIASSIILRLSKL